MIRAITKSDKALFMQMSHEFYHSPAVLHPVPESHYEKTFDMAFTAHPPVAIYMIECDGAPAGYGQVSFTYSTEAGGQVVWLEELYLREAFRNRGLGSAYFDFVKEEFKSAARLRLEVEPENTRAAALYGRMGFQKLGYDQMYFGE